MRYFLGKKPAREGSIKFSLSSYLGRKKFPDVPTVFGRLDVGQPWGMLGNDECGDCVFAGAAHETMLWARQGGGAARFDADAVVGDYSAVTGYDPRDPDTDQGTDMQRAAAYRRSTGVRDGAGHRHKIEAYVSLPAGDVEQLAVAAYLLGAVGVGLQMPEDAEDQFDAEQPWTSSTAKIAGGHYVPCVGRNSAGNFLVVTWGRVHAVAPRFLEERMDEGAAYLSAEMLREGRSWRGMDVAALRADLAALAA